MWSFEYPSIQRGGDYQSVPHHDGWRRGIMGHTSPVYIACGGDYQLFDPEAAQYMLTLVQGGLDYIRHRSPQHHHDHVTHHHGEADHLAYLERPFQEAMAAIHERMHEAGHPALSRTGDERRNETETGDSALALVAWSLYNEEWTQDETSCAFEKD